MERKTCYKSVKSSLIVNILLLLFAIISTGLFMFVQSQSQGGAEVFALVLMLEFLLIEMGICVFGIIFNAVGMSITRNLFTFNKKHTFVIIAIVINFVLVANSIFVVYLQILAKLNVIQIVVMGVLSISLLISTIMTIVDLCRLGKNKMTMTPYDNDEKIEVNENKEENL